MDVTKAIDQRRSIRHFNTKSIEFEKIALILENAGKAPSSGDIKDYRFILVTDYEVIRNIAQACTEQYWIETAPVVIVVCADKERSESFYGDKGKNMYSIQNAAAATQNALLTATEQGLGSCWVGSFDDEKISMLLKMPPHVDPQAVIALGYYDEEPSEKELDIEHYVYFGSYGNKFSNLNLVTREYSKEIEKQLKKQKRGLDYFSDKLKKYIESIRKNKQK